jgi:large subunit ribosomal protein L15
MIHLSTLTKTVKRPKKRLGQGLGSGKGKTGGRGSKGQQARGNTPVTQGDAGAAYLRRLPLFRGRSRNKAFRPKAVIVTLQQLSTLEKNTVVTIAELKKQKLIPNSMGASEKVKILGTGDISVALVVQVPCSGSAKEKIEKAGGKVE